MAWSDPNAQPEAMGTSCLWHPEIEAVSIDFGVPRCKTCASTWLLQRYARLGSRALTFKGL